MRRVTLPVVLPVVLGVAMLVAANRPALVRAEGFRVYSNPRFGATAVVPTDWRSGPPPENGDGLIFRSRDGTATETISGILIGAATPDQAMREEEKAGTGETVTYRRRSGRSVTVSGTRGDTIFFRRSLLVCHDQIWNQLSIEYPSARKAQYDVLVTKLAGSLHFSGTSEQISDCR